MDTTIQPDDIADLLGEKPAPLPDQEVIKASPKILVVDDLRMMRFAVAEVIAKLGYGVLEAADADQPHSIFLDVNMHGMSGIHVLKKLRSNMQLEAVPVVVLAIEKRLYLMCRVAALSVEDHRLKPARRSQIQRSVAAHLS